MVTKRGFDGRWGWGIWEVKNNNLDMSAVEMEEGDLVLLKSVRGLRG